MDKRNVIRLAKEINSDCCYGYRIDQETFAGISFDGVDSYYNNYWSLKRVFGETTSYWFEHLNVHDKVVRFMYIEMGYSLLDVENEILDSSGDNAYNLFIRGKMDLLNIPKTKTVQISVYRVRDGEEVKHISFAENDTDPMGDVFWEHVLDATDIDAVIKAWVEYLKELYIESMNGIIEYKVEKTDGRNAIVSKALKDLNSRYFKSYDVDKVSVHKNGILELTSDDTSIHLPQIVMSSIYKFYNESDVETINMIRDFFYQFSRLL